MRSAAKESGSLPLSENEKRHFSTYEKRPPEDLLGRQSKKMRTYFDSGDFALSAAHRVTNNGSIQTGRDHPHRDSISNPFAPVPSTSNASKDANVDLYREKDVSPERRSLLCHEAHAEHKNSTSKEEQGEDYSTH
ncbi:hypothetical protein N7492_006747 [Penicillium capsulatum]|uniref:mRNA stability protein n=1 Tax=Penicillium capsulatum TaxID=69766 RepID=A0A9W9I208_9EURO|nr:hypothetical protein N7492_006747 [Penicillium capsulatum]KAJ6116583.1 hypothetical protein N7512_006308 [Penicillium capsulatum]